MLQRLTKPAFRPSEVERNEPAKKSPKQIISIQNLDRPDPPVIRSVTHHSVELTWDRPMWSDGKSNNRLKYAIQEEDKKTKGFGTVYIGYADSYTIEGLEPLQSYKYRLKVTNNAGDTGVSPLISVCTTKEPYNGQHLHKAVMQNNEDSILKILSSGEVQIEVTDVLGYTPLMNASQKGFLNVVNILLEHGADVEAKNASGKNSLMLACFIGNLEIVKRLRLSGASWDVMDRGGSTPVHWAVDSGNPELVEWMVSDGAKIGIRDRTAGWTPLLRCCALSGNKKIAHSLIKMGSNVNASDEDGKTPLMIAALNGHTDLVKELVTYGANVDAKNKYGKSAIDMAKSFDRRV
ncbi:fibronectin type 3 and ankyrin repeat domains 1 protein-like isoform X2 [Styela clava]|uniref:fibronectin type 3 and ankyrin repeat domains 1 protein-like isoform X2 n=1 Tax=Styela clava TaxID=7725 RepID=UPI00193927A1|nr:fibronectin type 3 and ankyrin repeat domains 1 protein-like isoform X2 [Styela clava]XP_039262723.1 fibronectin type 3 and ankyrin repeat domains 1 protein-like isoform X2 [Styela clava]XP_039262724.1 fibronectin type 3 and ankyrin repeat domains 1 protein-like isoform X2 [Styela clava]